MNMRMMTRTSWQRYSLLATGAVGSLAMALTLSLLHVSEWWALVGYGASLVLAGASVTYFLDHYGRDE